MCLAKTSQHRVSDTTSFRLTITTPSGNLTIPQVATNITLGGRQSKVIVSSYTFGKSSSLQYSTAQIFYSGVIDGRDVLFLYGDSSQEHEASLVPSGTPSKVKIQSSSKRMVSYLSC